MIKVILCLLSVGVAPVVYAAYGGYYLRVGVLRCPEAETVAGIYRRMDVSVTSGITFAYEKSPPGNQRVVFFPKSW